MTTENGSFFLLEYFHRGGWVMYPILVCSIVSMWISIERAYHFRRARADSRRLLNDIKEFLAEDLVYKAMARCDETPGPVAHVLKAIVKNKEKEISVVRDAAEAAMLEEIPRLERRLPTLQSIANISTLLGLLGTILGIIQTFQVIAAEPTGRVNIQLLAEGIWVAVLTTAFGLIVAIPTTIFYGDLSSRVRRFAIEVEQASNELVHFIQHHRIPPHAEAARARS